MGTEVIQERADEIHTLDEEKTEIKNESQTVSLSHLVKDPAIY